MTEPPLIRADMHMHTEYSPDSRSSLRAFADAAIAAALDVVCVTDHDTIEGALRLREMDVPFRVVVWKVVDWTTRGTDPRAKQDGTLPDDWDPAADGEYESVEDDYDFGLLIADLPERQRQVADLIYREGLSHEQAAERLGITRNAVDQALHNAHRKLAEKLGV